MDQYIIDKYNKPVPRYTSYPPANYFREMKNDEYLEAVRNSNNARDNHLSFYFHMPFCRHLCHYCACNSYAMMQSDVVREYLDAIHKEIDLLLPYLNKDRKIAQIHYGGGSPTAIDAAEIKKINQHLLSNFDTIDKPEIAIECHPGYLTLDNWKQLLDCGFTRFSIGVQDFNEQVLKTVNRRPSLEKMEDIFSLLRDNGARINLDFLYGLPGQTPDSFKATIEKAAELQPDRLVTFSYAHVPWLKKAQMILEKAGLPNSEDKEQMFVEASKVLHSAGYKSVGLDHFVRPDDELYTALETKQLHRNFQGYCTRRTTAQVYAFGVTGISQLDTAYAQNTKDIKEYIELVNRGELTIRKGYSLNHREQVTREVIESIMCNYHIDWEALAEHLQLSIDELKAATAYDEEKIKEFEKDGILIYNKEKLSMTEEGSPFVRNVAASLDPLMLNTTKSFSKPI